MLHTTVDLLLSAAPPNIVAEAPPGSVNILKVAGWILYLCALACVLGIAKSGAMLGVAGSGRGQQGGEHAIGFVIACIGAVICFSAGTIALALS